MIDGLSIAGYRSFGDVEVRIGDFGKVNIFIGPNNCGKSNILRFLKLVADSRKRGDKGDKSDQLDPLIDCPIGAKSRATLYGFQMKKGGHTDAIYKRVLAPFDNIIDSRFPELTESLWMSFSLEKRAGKIKPSSGSVRSLSAVLAARLNDNQSNSILNKMANRAGGTHEARAEAISTLMHENSHPKFDAYFVDAFRRITAAGDRPLSGDGLISELRKLQSPDLANYEINKQRFTKITTFLQTIIGEPEAKLEIPAERDMILVSIGGKVLPLESLGTGIHELVILAAAVTLIDGAIFCLEEPEIHLHPGLQKKFVRYILESTDNQYFIATHSSSFFDLAGVSLYSCKLVDEYTSCEPVSSSGEKHAVLLDLGYRPSDLLQANYIIWVEGPSDRLYLNHWISGKAPELIEGIHYTIMFYGGRLLAHLCFDDPMLGDFVRLSCLNRNACIVMDSDRSTSRDGLGRTKRRVRKEFQSNGCIAWVTAGRTIENYLPVTLLTQVLKKVHPKSHFVRKWAQFEDMTHLSGGRSIDKVAVARAIASEAADFRLLDLGKAINNLVAEIRRHNT